MDFEEDDEQLYEHFRMEVDKGQEPVRIDKFLSEHQPHSSRNRIQKAADAGFIHVNDRPVKSNYKVRPGDIVTLMLDRPHYDTTIEPEDIPLDVVYEDDDLMVINKPAGLVVLPRWGWSIASTRIQVVCLSWRRPLTPKPRWGSSSSTRRRTVVITLWYGVTSWMMRDVSRVILAVTRRTAFGWRCFHQTPRWVNRLSPIIR